MKTLFDLLNASAKPHIDNGLDVSDLIRDLGEMPIIININGNEEIISGILKTEKEIILFV